MNNILHVRPHLWICLFLVVVTLAVYAQSLGNDFINFDDPQYVTFNNNVQSGLTKDSVFWAFFSSDASNWHPLTWLTHIIDYQLYRLQPAGHHLTNLLLHILNTLLLFLVISRMTGYIWRSAFVAALFAIHPLHVESVAWIAERKDVLSTFFWMLTMLAYIRYSKSPNVRRYIPVLLLYALGLMAKPMLVTLPIVLLLLDYWPLRRYEGEKKQNLWHFVQEKIPLFILAAASSVITFLVQRNSGAVMELEINPVGERIANAVVSYAGYMGKMLWPAKLGLYYPHPCATPPTSLAIGLIVFAGLFTLAFLARRRYPYFTIGWLWYVGTLVPVIGFVQVGAQAMADRYTYLPLIGIFVIIAWGVPDLLSKYQYMYKRRYLLAIPAIFVIASLMYLTSLQVTYWRDSITLCEHTLKVTGPNATVENLLGAALAMKGKWDEAAVHYRKAVDLCPEFVEARCNLGTILADKGKYDEAIEQYKAALQVDPDSVNVVNVHLNLGVALIAKNNYEEAIVHFSEALRLKPDFALARNNLRLAKFRQKGINKAPHPSSKRQKGIPSSARAHCHLGLFLAEQGKLDESREHFMDALRIAPRYAEAHRGLAITLFFQEKYPEAWKEVHLCEKYGGKVNAQFLKALSNKMPETTE
ncbi:MAG: tetratricopeptide repeat protein [Armatimonadota bacterium]|nr:tetratricopeptide repeat protein [Armatimonadota bacterium]